MAADEIKDFLENGNIKNSVTMPAVSMAKSGAARVCVIHKCAVDAVCAKLSETAKVVAMASGSKKDYFYSIFDVAEDTDAEAVKAVDGVIRVRVIK